VIQVSSGSQSFNAVNTLCLLGRWMRMIIIPNQSSAAVAYQEFGEAGRMKTSAYYYRVADGQVTVDRGLAEATMGREVRRAKVRQPQSSRVTSNRNSPARLEVVLGALAVIAQGFDNPAI
jgi:hypothetical protein